MTTIICLRAERKGNELNACGCGWVGGMVSIQAGWQCLFQIHWPSYVSPFSSIQRKLCIISRILHLYILQCPKHNCHFTCDGLKISSCSSSEFAGSIVILVGSTSLCKQDTLDSWLGSRHPVWQAVGGASEVPTSRSCSIKAKLTLSHLWYCVVFLIAVHFVLNVHANKASFDLLIMGQALTNTGKKWWKRGPQHTESSCFLASPTK